MFVLSADLSGLVIQWSMITFADILALTSGFLIDRANRYIKLQNGHKKKRLGASVLLS